MKKRRLKVLISAMALVAVCATAAPAEAGELSAFLAFASPNERWAGGGGAAFAIGFFKVTSFEAEGAYVPGESEGQKMLSFTASAFLAPSIGSFVPYAGLGIGVARQEAGTRSDSSVVRTLAVGVKLHVGPLLLLKAEYRKIGLPDDALIPMDNRYSLGAGISF